MISFNVKQRRSEDQTKPDQYLPDPCACTCHRKDVEDGKYRTVCMSCTCYWDDIPEYQLTEAGLKEKESSQRKRKE